MPGIDTADSLTRNDRVIRDNEPFPFLVDDVEERAGTIFVTYSNGDTVPYPKHHPVIVLDRD